MEPVEQKGQLLRRNGGPQVLNGGVDLALFFRGGDGQGRAGGGEFRRVVQQIVADLRYRVRVPPHHQRLLRKLHIHV